MKIDALDTFQVTLQLLKSTFFPNKRSHLGHEKSFTFSIGNYGGQSYDSATNMEQMVGGGSKPSIYLLTKQVSSPYKCRYIGLVCKDSTHLLTLSFLKNSVNTIHIGNTWEQMYNVSHNEVIQERPKGQNAVILLLTSNSFY